MELVEGETLHDRLLRGRVPLDEALNIARQMVDALETAHGRGIVHRDLKPANIKLTPAGTVKVLDFGLARLETSGAANSAGDLSDSPTITNVSMPGVILGTLAYMSPEQARGKVVDSRSDVWSFGCVLFEMLAGRQPFIGETATDIIAHVLTGEPAWDRLAGEVTSPVRTLLAAALTKDPKRRLQHIGDARLFLSAPPVPEAPSVRGIRFGWRWAAGLVSLVAALAIAAFVYARRPPVAATETRFEMPAPGFVRDLTISPDGQRLAYVATSEGRARIWIQPIGSLTAQPLPGTEDANALFWSPDSRYLGFVALPGALQKIDVSGGPPQRVAEAFVNVPGTWSRDGTILFTSLDRGGPSLARVPSSGGQVQVVTTTLPPGVGATGLVLPQFLPDGRRFLFVAASRGEDPSGAVMTVLYAGSLDSTSATRLMDLDPWQPGSRPSTAFRYVEPGYLLFTRNQALMAQRFDTARVALTGSAVSLAEGIQDFSASDTGALVYRKSQGAGGAPSGSAQLLWVDRTGKPAGQVALPPYAANPRLSPDGRRIAVDALNGSNRDIWVIDIAQGAPSRLTFDPAGDWYPVWAPDSDQIVYASGRRGSSSRVPRPGPNMVTGSELYVKPVNGAGADTMVLASDDGELLIPEDWSADGRYIVFRRVKLSATSSVLPDLWALPLFGDRKPFPLVQSPAVKGFARLSPDGRWLAYMTNESGPFQVVVQPFPDTSKGTWQVSRGAGAEEMMWRRDGGELFFLAGGKLLAATVRGGDAFESGSPQALFATPPGLLSSPAGTRANVTADGQRFLFTVQVTEPVSETSLAPVPITAVVNWTAALEAR
jgi:Tol biopolymer transport system component